MKSQPELGLFWCGKCLQLLGRENFYACQGAKLGVQSRCKECTSIRLARKRPGSRVGKTPEQREESRKAIAKEWRQKNKTHMREKLYQWRAENPEMDREIRVRSRKKNIAKVIARNQQRRGYIKRATPAWADKEAITDLYVLAKVLSAETSAQIDVDHIIPLRGALVCGLHVGANLRLLPRKENQLKHNKFEVAACL